MLQVLGLHILRFFSTLMPLLLGWCHEPDQATCLAALQALQEVIRHTWPRMPAHATFLWSELQQISTEQAWKYPSDEGKTSSDSDGTLEAQILPCIAGVAEMLYLCGGGLFQNVVQDAWRQNKDPMGDVML